MKKFFASLIFVLFLLGAVTPGIAAEKRGPLRDTTEWIRLSCVWRELSEHWIGKTVSREKFEGLGTETERRLSLLANLKAREYFGDDIQEPLERLFHQRYAFIREQRYQLRPFIVMTDLDSHAFMARSRLEDALARLLWPPVVEDVPKLKKRSREEVAVQLEFLRRCVEVQELISFHRAEAQKKEAEGEEVNWNQFQMEAFRHTRALIDEYVSGKIKPRKEILDLQQYLLSLTEEPLPPPEAYTNSD